MQDFGAAAKGDAIVLVNGFGGTPSMELYLMFDNAALLLERHGIRIARSLVGNYVTSLEMAGCSITVTIADQAMLALWDAPVHTSALRWG
jgi:dihydroxyacetone kinase-like protein